MQSLRLMMPFSRSVAIMHIIVLTLLVLPLLLVIQTPWGSQQSSSAMVSTLVDGSAQKRDSDSQVADGTLVLMNYTITIPEADITLPDNFTIFEYGQHEFVPDIEGDLAGMKKGEEKHIQFTPEEAFGPYDESKRVEISKDLLPADVQPGMRFLLEEDLSFVVIDLVGPTAKIDFNHPLAGKRVEIDVRILDVAVLSECEHTLQPDYDVISWPPMVSLI